MSTVSNQEEPVFSIICTSFREKQLNTFYVFDEGQSSESQKLIRNFLVRVVGHLDNSDAQYFMEVRLVQFTANEWRLDQIDPHEEKADSTKRFRGKGIPNILLPTLAKRLGVSIRSSPPLGMFVEGSDTGWRTPDATRMWENLSDHLATTGSEYTVEHTQTRSDDFFRLVKRSVES